MMFLLTAFDGMRRFFLRGCIVICAVGLAQSVCPSVYADDNADHFWEIERRDSIESQVLRATSDAFPNGLVDLRVVWDGDHGISSLRIYDEKNRKTDEFPSVNIQKGIVLISRQGYDIIKIKS